MARMKFLCDAERCIECNSCVTACKNANDVPWGVNRRRVVTIDDGVPGEKSISVACMHCSDAPCMAVCPVDCFVKTPEGVVLHDKDLCIGCGYCFYACPFGAPQFPQDGAFGLRGKMDKCTFCAGGPGVAGTEAEYEKYGANRLAEGKLPLCAEMCSTKALLGGDGNVVADIYRTRVLQRGKGSEVWGWGTAWQTRTTETRYGGTQVMRKSRRNFLMAAAVSPVALVACGKDEKQAVVYKQGTYQGAKYTPPWENDRFKGDERAWQDALRLRAQNQNDYARMGDTQRGNL